MTAIPKEIHVLLGKSAYQDIQHEQWGAYELFRQAIVENQTDTQGSTGLRLARPFYERFLQHLLMFDDVFDELNEVTAKNKTAITILEHIKAQITGKQYHKLNDRSHKAVSTLFIDKALTQRILARRAEHGSMEAFLKKSFIQRQFEEEGANFLFHLKSEDEFLLMRDTLAYAAMVEALQTSEKSATRLIGDRLAKENYLRVMLAHRILDAREGFRVKQDVFNVVRDVLSALDRDQNGVLSLCKAGESIDEDVSAQKHPELWRKLNSYDTDGNGFLTSAEQMRLKEAIGRLVDRGIEFSRQPDGFMSFEEVERVLSQELPNA